MGEGQTASFECEISGPVEGMDAQIDSLLGLSRELLSHLSPKSSGGSISMRAAGSFLINAEGAKTTELMREELSFVYDVDEAEFALKAKGSPPSPDAFLHYYIYKSYPEINIVLHFMDPRLEEKAMHLPSVGPFARGSHDLAREAAKPKASVARIIEQGFVVKARNGAELLGTLNALRSI